MRVYVCLKLWQFDALKGRRKWSGDESCRLPFGAWHAARNRICC